VALGPNQAHIQWVGWGGSFPGVTGSTEALLNFLSINVYLL
jgi:hypothetical protein